MDKKRIQRTKHNHSSNLRIVINEFRKNKKPYGVHLDDLAFKCDVSTRQVYRYLSELQNMGYEIVKSVGTDSNSSGYIMLNTEPTQNFTRTLTNMLKEFERVSVELQAAKVFIQEFLIRYSMVKLGIIIPFTTPLWFDSEDAITVRQQSFVYRDPEEHSEEVIIKVSPKVISHVIECLNTEINSQQRLKDGWFNLNFKTNRVREITGLLTQWGSDVEVIEPGWLKHKMLENCKAILHANRLKKIDRSDEFIVNSHYLVNN